MLENWLKTTTLMAAVVVLRDPWCSTKNRGAYLVSRVRGLA